MFVSQAQGRLRARVPQRDARVPRMWAVRAIWGSTAWPRVRALYSVAMALRRPGRSNFSSADLRSSTEANVEVSEFACNAIRRRFAGLGWSINNC